MVDRLQSDYFNPRAPCGARPKAAIRLLTTGKYFNPRAPCGARRTWYEPIFYWEVISTHAPLAGRDFGNIPLHT